MAELSSRQQTILGLVVKHYIATAQPVGSRTLLENYLDLQVSSATIRNEMAVLEEMGYLTHPHTSAGRIPTDKGYRYFVERLLGDIELSATERNTIRHQFHQARLEMAQWMQLAAAVLARSLRGAALITAPKMDKPRLRQLSLLSTQAQRALMVVVFQGGNVLNRSLTFSEPTSPELLIQLANKLNAAFENLDGDGIRRKLTDFTDFEREVVQHLLQLLLRDTDVNPQQVFRDGLSEVLQEPEFERSSEANALVNALEQPSFLAEVLEAPIGTVQVVIGGEGRWQELSTCSLVLAKYGVAGFATGALGVLGPTRMPYGRAISTVRYVADLMSDMVSDLYSE
ncbi:MAG: heat-inducible transcriptional repressor HrcA [Chloroflexi bacterium]|nr:heat-inducible transcriptional repressor HrcA [Chloroflexota bacterium]